MEMDLWNRLCDQYEEQVKIHKDFRGICIDLLDALEKAYRLGDQEVIANIRRIIDRQKSRADIPEEPKPKVAAQILQIVQASPKPTRRGRKVQP